MRIEDLRTTTTADRARIAATVIWEDCDREPQEVFYETTRDFADDLTWRSPRFPGRRGMIPAVGRGERRIAIDAPICPELREGILTAIAWLHVWLLPEDGIPHTITIESRRAVRYPQTIIPRAASFMSGGVDSLAILRANRLAFPQDHPGAFKDCLFVHGFDIGALVDGPLEMDFYDLALQSVAAVAVDAGVTLIPVYTNVRHLYDDVHFWTYRFHGAALASVAHAFSARLTSVSIASGFRLPHLAQAATHPLIDPNYGSANLRFRHEGTLYSRFDRVRLIAEWPAALAHVRVCTMNPPGKLNCGECEKCRRTMLELLALGSLNKTAAFPYQDVVPEMLADIQFTEKYQSAWYTDLIAPLAAQGRYDLVETIQKKCDAFQKYLAWEEERDLKGAIKRFDRRWLKSSLYKTYDRIRNGPASKTPTQH